MKSFMSSHGRGMQRQERKIAISHPAPLPPLCGAFCIGCEICCDLVDELDSATKSEKTSKKFAGEEKTEQSLTLYEKNNTQISHDVDKYQRSQKRAKCSEKTCCRNVICDCNNIYRTACTCSRKRAAHETRCKSEKLHYIALCCIGKLACCRRSISPRGRGECRCITKRCW